MADRRSRRSDARPCGRARTARQQFSTVVVWENLDRLLPGRTVRHGAGRAADSRRPAERAGRASVDGVPPISRWWPTETGRDDAQRKVCTPWDPFAPAEPEPGNCPPLQFEIAHDDHRRAGGRAAVLPPPRSRFSSAEQWERLSGPLKWNRQQGLYIYRADRSCSGEVGPAFAPWTNTPSSPAPALEFDTDLDTAFNINVAKMRVGLPAELRQLLEQPVQEFCLTAQEVYRRSSQIRGNLPVHNGERANSGRPVSSASAGLALRSAALQSGDYEALQRIVHLLTEQMPDLVDALGLRDL